MERRRGSEGKRWNGSRASLPLEASVDCCYRWWACAVHEMFYGTDKLTFEMSQHSRRWTLAVDRVQADTWYFIELSWHLHSGFQVRYAVRYDARGTVSLSVNKISYSSNQGGS